MRILLAPMEGLIDTEMRELLTSVGGIHLCTTEFVRINNNVLSKKEFYPTFPELESNGLTKSGTPVFVQLLGSHPELMAQNAVEAVKLGAKGIDLNFGCPSKKVNSHDGGAVLLKEPSRLFQIVNAVRKHVPNEIPVTAKIRLGYEDKSLAIENSQAIESAGANALTVHARTKIEGYKPPAHWDWIAKIKESVKLPVIANGDIWNVEDYIRCRNITSCEDIMIGRGLIYCPDLALGIQCYNQNVIYNQDGLTLTIVLLERFYHLLKKKRSDLYILARIKQWVRLLSQKHLFAKQLFEKIKVLNSAPTLLQVLKNEPR